MLFPRSPKESPKGLLFNRQASPRGAVKIPHPGYDPPPRDSGRGLAAHGFLCEVSWSRLFGIQWTNFVATVATLGLFRPFAQVRLARYYATAFVLMPAGTLDTLLAADSDEVSAVGEEAAGFFDLDIGF